MRQLIIARKDLQMSPGKLAAQCCHASLAFLTDPIGMGQGVEPIEKDGEITGYRAEIMLEKATYEEGLTVVRNYLSCGWGRGRCDRKGHAVFLRPRVDSAIMGSASTGISTSSTKLKKISTFCRRLPPDLSGA